MMKDLGQTSIFKKFEKLAISTGSEGGADLLLVLDELCETVLKDNKEIKRATSQKKERNNNFGSASQSLLDGLKFRGF